MVVVVVVVLVAAVVVLLVVGPCHHDMRVLRMEERPPIRRVAANKLNKQSRTADRRWSSSLGFGRGANNPSL